MIDYLRISLTNLCNLNCIYCNPFKRRENLQGDCVLSPEEIEKIVKVFSLLGVNKVRLTGGEPLLRKDIMDVVFRIKSIKGIKKILLTTNGVLLKDFISELKNADIYEVNVSLDTLKKDKFLKITGRDELKRVLEGIDEAIKSGFQLKINTVLFKGINDDEIPDFIRYFRDKGVYLRFIEYSSTSKEFKIYENIGVREEEVKNVIKKHFGILETVDYRTNGPSIYYKLEGFRGLIGFISGKSRDFCSLCNRVRISQDGKLFLCLYSDECFDLRRILEMDIGDAMNSLRKILAKKRSYKNDRKREFYMVSIGG
ncbi:MAG: GTP 3',8-cyclase MoaA [Caldiserica bacterium]|nr:MAG: GTP 3',8-cyclase MoaA [Caldisericota bacterium]